MLVLDWIGLEVVTDD